MTSTVAARKIADILMRVARVHELLPPTAAEMVARRTECEALLLKAYDI